METNLPILYSFRRCPYAMRARMALYYSGVVCELREVVLKSKPQQMLDVSPKGTVPVLLPNANLEEILEESIDVMQWALSHSDPSNWLSHPLDHELIVRCDDYFKHWLDRYKYADRYPEQLPQVYFAKAVVFLEELEAQLVASAQDEYFLVTPAMSVLDVAVFPFVRQFAFVDKMAFDKLQLPKLQTWLSQFLDSQLFLSIMSKYPMWQADLNVVVLFGQVDKS